MKKFLRVLPALLLMSFLVLAAPIRVLCDVIPVVPGNDDSWELPVLGERAYDTEVPETDSYFLDNAGLLSAADREALNKKLQDISKRTGYDVRVLTMPAVDGSLEAFADDYYDFNVFAQNGLVFVYAKADSGWHISTHGKGIDAFTDAGIQYIGKQLKTDMRNGNYVGAFDSFAALAEDFIEHAKAGTPYTKDTLPKDPLGWGWLPGAGAIGAAVSGIATGAAKGKNKSVYRKSNAAGYTKEGLKLDRSIDLSHGKTTERKFVPRTTTSSDSTTHVSSSGEVHGGGGGHF